MTLSFDLFSEIATQMNSPERVLEIALASKNPHPMIPHSHHWGGINLGSGFAGILLMISRLTKEGFLDQGEEIIHRYVLMIKEEIETQGISNLSLFGGTTGLAFALEEASIDGKRYGRMVEALRTFLYENIDVVYFDPLTKNIHENVPSNSLLFDVIQGISGVGRYLLEHLDDPIAEKKLRQLLKVLVDLVQPRLIQEHQVPGWLLSLEDPLNQLNKPDSALGNFNLGLAHGITGVLALFAIASLRGVEVEGQKEAMGVIEEWIWEKSFILNGQIRWSYSVLWEEEIGNKKQQKEPAKDAWCYGVPGIARTLYLTGRALKDNALCQDAQKAFWGVFERSREEWELRGSGICHGIGGLLLLTHAMAHEPDGEKFLPKVDELKRLLEKDLVPEAPWKFRDWERSTKGDWHHLDKPSFLEGASGIVLTLLHIANPQSNWHLPLMIHD